MVTIAGRVGRTLVGLFAIGLIACEDPGFMYLVSDQETLHTREEFTVKEMVFNVRADILWVIDNSGSMDEFQRQVILNTDRFIQQFHQFASQGDWKMGLISTDFADRRSPYAGFHSYDRIDSKSPDPVGTFQRAVRQLGTRGSPDEKTYEPVLLTLSRYPDFLRKGSMLFLIVVSDEPEQSRQTTPEFIEIMNRVLGGPDRLVAYGAFFQSESRCTRFPFQGSKYQELIQLTQGKAYPICSDQFGDNLAEIGKDIAKRIEQARLKLKLRPILSTLRVFHNEKELKGGPKEEGGYWIYDVSSNTVIFHDLDFAEGDFEKVRVIYDASPLPQ